MYLSRSSSSCIWFIVSRWRSNILPISNMLPCPNKNQRAFISGSFSSIDNTGCNPKFSPLRSLASYCGVQPISSAKAVLRPPVLYLIISCNLLFISVSLNGQYLGTFLSHTPQPTTRQRQRRHCRPTGQPLFCTLESGLSACR